MLKRVGLLMNFDYRLDRWGKKGQNIDYVIYEWSQKRCYKYTANFSVLIFTTASHDRILRCSPDVEFTSGSCIQLRDVIWMNYISTKTEEM